MSNHVPTTTYKGNEIVFYEHSEEWYCGDLHHKSYKSLCVIIDKNLRADFPHERVAVHNPYNGKWHYGETTSMTVDGSNVRVKLDGERGATLHSIRNTYRVTKETQPILDELAAIGSAIESLEKDRDKLIESLPPYAG